MSVRTWPFLAWRYSLNRAVAFLHATGFVLRMWGIVIPITRDGGLVVAWMRREPVIVEPDND